MATILYPTRGGDTTHRNQDWVFSFTKENNARLILLYVSNVRFLDTLTNTVGVERVREELDELGDFLLTMGQDRADKVGVTADKALRHGRFREALKDVIEQENVSTVVLGRPAQGTAITTAEYIQEIAEYLTAETDVEVYLMHEGKVIDHILPRKGTTMTNMQTTQLGSLETAANQANIQLANDNILPRIWDHDHTVWNPDPEEISNRLGWLHLPQTMLPNLDQIDALVQSVKDAAYTNVLLLGMGGSSLAPEVFSKTFGPTTTGLHLEVCDSTHPDTIQAYTDKLDLARTLFIVSTKSGGTVETLSFFKYFYNQTAHALGEDQAGSHFVAITDPGSKLEKLAVDYNFRQTFLNDPNIGGRYSVLSFFGLVPAALIGIDIRQLLSRAGQMNSPEGNAAGAMLGATLGAGAKNGRDKLTLITSPEIASVGDWVEQLVAESTGKNGKGILPVVSEPLGEPEVYANDRLFIHLRLAGDNSHSAALNAVAQAGHPVTELELADLYDLGPQFFLWEMATAVAGHIMGIHPFDQPNVESAKKRATAMVNAYQEQGKLPESNAEPLTRESSRAFPRPGQTRRLFSHTSLC